MTWQVRRRRALFVRGHPVRDASEEVREINVRSRVSASFSKKLISTECVISEKCLLSKWRSFERYRDIARNFSRDDISISEYTADPIDFVMNTISYRVYCVSVLRYCIIDNDRVSPFASNARTVIKEIVATIRAGNSRADYAPVSFLSSPFKFANQLAILSQ